MVEQTIFVPVLQSLKRGCTCFAVSSFLSTATAFVEVKRGGIFTFLSMLPESCGRVANLFWASSLAFGSDWSMFSFLGRFALLPKADDAAEGPGAESAGRDLRLIAMGR